jgi:hypothetical protein
MKRPLILALVLALGFAASTAQALCYTRYKLCGSHCIPYSAICHVPCKPGFRRCTPLDGCSTERLACIHS